MLYIIFVLRFESHYNAALSIGVTLMVLVYMFGRISGAQLNPAVTLAVKLADDAFSWGDVAPYWLAQITGAVRYFISQYYVFYER